MKIGDSGASGIVSPPMTLDASDTEIIIDNGAQSDGSNTKVTIDNGAQSDSSNDVAIHGPPSVGVRRSIINGLQLHAYSNLARHSSNTEVIIENETHFDGNVHIAIHGPTPIVDGSCDMVNGIQLHKYDDMLEGGRCNKIHLRSPTVFSGLNIEICSPQENVSTCPPLSQVASNQNADSSLPNQKHGKKNKAVGNVDLYSVFAELCHNETMAGNMKGTVLTKEGWSNIISNFQKRTGRTYDQKQLGFFLDRMKQEWKKGYRQKMEKPGRGWDYEKNTDIANAEGGTNYLQWCQAALHNHEKNVPKVEADTIAHNVKHRATDPKQDNDNARRDPNGPRRRKRSEDGDVIPLPKKSRRLSVFANLRKWLSEFGMHLIGRTTFNRVDPDCTLIE